MTMATRVDILENYFANGQHNISVFQPVTSNFEDKNVASVALMCSPRWQICSKESTQVLRQGAWNAKGWFLSFNKKV